MEIKYGFMYILFQLIFICRIYTISAQFNLRKHNEKQIGKSANNSLSLLRQIKRPPSGDLFNRNKPLSVIIGVYLESLGNFRVVQMSFDVDLYIYMSWRDVQLRHAGPDSVMINDDAVRKQLWLPDLYFANAIESKTHEVTVPNFNLFIASDGTVAYSSRVTLTVACNLDMMDYPMDRQKCYMKIQSYAYIAKIVKVTWLKKVPISLNPKIELPEYQISRLSAEYCNGSYRYAITENYHKFDEFSCLTANLYLTRRLGFSMLQSYLPTGLIVIISWCSFWIDRRSVPARVTISFTTLLSMTTIGNGMHYALPQVSYAKAIDYWFGVCMLNVFFALVEYAIVNSYMRRSETLEKLAKNYYSDENDDLNLPVQNHSANNNREKVEDKVSKRLPRKSSKADSLAIDMTEDYVSAAEEISMRLPRKASKTEQKNSVAIDIPEDYESAAEEEGYFWPIQKASLLNQNQGFMNWRNKNLSVKYLKASKQQSRSGLRLDKISRILFPISFLIFNIFYWTYYLIIRRNNNENF